MIARLFHRWRTRPCIWQRCDRVQFLMFAGRGPYCVVHAPAHVTMRARRLAEQHYIEGLRALERAAKGGGA